MDMFTTLAVAFIGVCILVVMIDQIMIFLQTLLAKIPALPDEFEWYISYAMVVFMSYIVVWRSHFSFFEYLNFEFNHDWEGYLLTAIMISGGSVFIKKQWDLMNYIPTGIFSINTLMKSKKSIKTDVTRNIFNATTGDTSEVTIRESNHHKNKKNYENAGDDDMPMMD